MTAAETSREAADRRRRPPRPPALYAVARAAIATRAADALEVVLGSLRPRRSDRPFWKREEHLLAAASEAEDLARAAERHAERLEAAGAVPLARVMRDAERRLDTLVRRVRVRISSQGRVLQAGTCLRPTVALTFVGDPRPASAIADRVSARHQLRREPDRRLRVPIRALAKDVAVLGRHLAPGTGWPEAWGDLVALRDLAATATALAADIEQELELAAPGAKTTRGR